ncbi:MAG: hypothetical protein WKF77_06130 [Planctomycetaceae bacterium]
MLNPQQQELVGELLGIVGFLAVIAAALLWRLGGFRRVGIFLLVCGVIAIVAGFVVASLWVFGIGWGAEESQSGLEVFLLGCQKYGSQLAKVPAEPDRVIA